MIAYTIVAPDAGALAQWMESAVPAPHAEGTDTGAAISGDGRTIAAYDGDLLVGYGKVVAGTEGSRLNVWVHPAYRKRDVDRVIGKLLNIRPGADDPERHYASTG